MVKPFKMKNRKNYYFQVMVDGKRTIESTGETNFNKATKKATERIKELRGGGNYLEALKRLVDCLNALPVEERDSARSECLEKINEGTIFKIKLEDAFDAYREKSKKREVSERTYQEYKSLWGKFCEWVKDYSKRNSVKIEYLNEITQSVAEKYLASEWEKEISERTYNERIKKFRAMFRALSKDANLRKNVWHTVDKKTEQTISKEPLSKQQLKELFKVADDEMKVLFAIGLYTGLRLKDACLLKKKSVNFDNNTITVTPSKTKSTGKKINIPMHEVLKVILEKAFDVSENEFVLPEIAKQSLKPYSFVSNRIQQTFRKAGIETTIKRDGAKRKTAVYGFHSFRHSFVSLLARENIPVHVVMKLVGHNSKTIHQVYQHANEKDKKIAINKIENYLTEKETDKDE